MPRLEDLPPELIEMIFFESLNLSLPKASPRLGNALSSPKIKIKLVSTAFSSNTYWRINHYDQISSKLWTGHPRSTDIAMGKLQSDILSCRWANWDFMKSYYEDFLTKTIVQEFREQGLKWANGEPVAESLVRSYVHDIVYQDVVVSGVPRTDVGTDSDRDGGYHVLGLVSYDHCDRPMKAWRPLLTAAFVARSWLLDDGSSKVAVGIGRWTGLLTIGSSLVRQDGKNMVREQRDGKWKSLLCACQPCQIPAKLLVGPWTREKLHFLDALVEAFAVITNDEDERMAEKGLMDAIREDNYRAVDLLASDSCYEPDGMGRTFVEPSMGWATFDFTSSMEGVSASVERAMPRRTCGILPTTEHLKVAVMERGCCEMVVRRLLFAQGAKIDVNDKSITKWISGRKAAFKEEGWWLQYQLQRSAERQPKRRANTRPWYWCERDLGRASDLGSAGDLGGGSGSEPTVGNLPELSDPVRRLGVDDENDEEDWEDIEDDGHR
ncbi:MAG: hypothetical protein Q9208_004446 [Pyrenodesmia sp. 3 TL-2023]